MNVLRMFFFMLLPFLGLTQNEVDQASIKVFPADPKMEIRTFDQEKLDEYKLQSDFQYEEADYEQSEFSKAWDRFWRKIFSFFNGSLDNKWLNRIISLIILFFVLRYVIKMNSQNLVDRTDEKMSRYVEELDIRMKESTIKDKLEKAKGNSKWRDAVRYSYLLTLKKLNEEDKIRWKEWKLSSDYLEELKEPELISGFTDLTNMFNFTWYGERKLSEDQYLEFEGKFTNFMNQSIHS